MCILCIRAVRTYVAEEARVKDRDYNVRALIFTQSSSFGNDTRVVESKRDRERK